MLRSPLLMTWKCVRARSAKVHACGAQLKTRISRNFGEGRESAVEIPRNKNSQTAALTANIERLRTTAAFLRISVKQLKDKAFLSELQYQHCNIRHGDELILSALSNGPYGTTVGVFQEDMGPNDQSYLRMIGTLDQRDAERINSIARPQLAGAWRPRGGPRVGSRFCPDIQSATISPFSPQYVNGYPPNFGVLPAGPGCSWDS